ncbi:MAG: hypothetical protein Q9165_003614 [Trypethelium subeluteriae]
MFPSKRSPPATICSESSSLVIQSAKRRMLLPPIEFRNPFHGLGLPSDTIGAHEHHLLSCRPDDYRAPAPDDFERWISPRQFNDPDMISLHIDLSQNVDEFSDENIYEMKRAADFLAALDLDEDAFVLYVLILKRLKTLATCSDWMIIWTVVACSRMAFSRGQCEIARSLLKQRLSEYPGSAPIVNKFLARMLLADTYWRCDDEKNERINIEAAMHTANTNPSLLSTLPSDHRSFDLYTYHFLSRKSRFIEPSQRLKKTIPYCHKVNKIEAQRTILYQRPGPFEIDNGVMANPCLRSCLQWTAHELKYLKPDSALLATPTLIKRKRMGIRAEREVLFCRLWECWQSGANTSEHQFPWTTKAEKLMGISASMLLKRTVGTIEEYVPSEPLIDPVNDAFSLKWRYASRAQLKAHRLLEESDLTLAKCFEKFSKSELFLEAFDSDIIREYAKQKLENGLKMILPAIIFNASDAKANGRRYYGSGEKTPSCASIPTDSDLSSFHALGDRIQNTARTMGHGLKTTRPSSVLRGHPTDAASLVSMDDMSTAFRSISLNSSGFQFGSTSTL